MGRIARLAEKIGPALAGLAVLLLLIILRAGDPAPLERLRLQAFDGLQRAAPRELPQDQSVAIIDVDEASIAQLGQWPWPRTDLAELTRRLGEAGATVVAFDIVFSESDRTSPDAIIQRYQQMGRGDGLGGALAQLPGHDALFAESFAAVPVVTGFFLDREGGGGDIVPKSGFTLSGTMPDAQVASYSGSLQAIARLESAAQGNGSLSLDGDADNIVRRAPLAAIHRGTLVPSLSLEAVRVATGASSPNLLASDGSGETLSSPGAAVAVRLNGQSIPVNDAAEMWVHFPAVEDRTVIPAGPVISGEMSDSQLADRVSGRLIFVGGSAVGLQDLVSTPLSERIAGVTVHAAAAEQMLAGHFLERPDWAFGLELLLVLVCGIALALALPRLGAALGAVAALAAIIGIAALSWFAFTGAQYLLDPTWPILSLIAIYAVQTVAVYYREERQRSYIHAAFDRYLSPEIVRQIASNPERLELGGEERDMSVLMCDIRGFSRMSEQYSPREVIDFLVEFLTPMSELLLERRATIDKYIGDAILAFWNAPLDDPDHHRNAARAALEMQAKTQELNRTMPQREGVVWPGDVTIGVGLNSGLCCVGNMGSRQRLSYSLIGDTVNMAARLEGLTKQYGVPIVVGQTMAAELSGFALLELDRVRVVGREAPETIFALLGDEAAESAGKLAQLAKAHAAMLKAYRAQDWDGAEEKLTAAASLYQDYAAPGLQALFQTRIASLRGNPPASDWDGVFQATSK